MAHQQQKTITINPFPLPCGEGSANDIQTNKPPHDSEVKSRIPQRSNERRMTSESDACDWMATTG
jgi:hypothetical protein